MAICCVSLILRRCSVRPSTPHSSGFRGPCIWPFLSNLGKMTFSAACWPFKFGEDSIWRAWGAEKGNEENLEWTGIFGKSFCRLHFLLFSTLPPSFLNATSKIDLFCWAWPPFLEEVLITHSTLALAVSIGEKGPLNCRISRGN